MKLTDTDEADDVDTCTAIVSLMQKYRRQMKTSLKQTENLEEAVGFDILKVTHVLHIAFVKLLHILGLSCRKYCTVEF